MIGRSTVFAFALLAACGSTPPADPDASSPIDAPLDAAQPLDAARPSDARLDARPDARRADAGPDAPSFDAPPPGDGGMPLADLRERLCATFARGACIDRTACECPDERAPDDPSCIADETAFCEADLRKRLGPFLADGSVRVDLDALTACSARVSASFSGCSTTKEDVQQWCEGVLVTSAPIGGRCVITGANCADGAGTCASGECVRLPAREEPCLELGRCAAGLTCRSGACVPLAAELGPCDRDGHCEGDLVCAAGECRSTRTAIDGACAQTGDCVAGAICSSARCSEPGTSTCTTDSECPSLWRCAARFGRRCRTALPLGSSCASSVACGPDAYCDGTCQPRRGAGSPCPFGDEQCTDDSVCDTRGSPTCRGVSGIGGPCWITGFPGRDGCSIELACVRGTCTVWPGAGELCGDDGECAPGLGCRTDPGTGEGRCGAPGSEGETCNAFRGEYAECAPGLYCDGDVFPNLCRRQRGAGEACSGHRFECHDGLSCTRDASGRAICTPIPSRGMECSDLCEIGLVCADTELPSECSPTVCDAIGGSAVDVPPPER